MTEQVKFRVLSNGPRAVEDDEGPFISTVLCKTTTGKIYDATLYRKGEPLDLGFAAIMDTIVFTNDCGQRADTFLQGPELELVAE